MNSRESKSIGWLVLLGALLSLAVLPAQTLPFVLTAGSGGNAVDFELRLDGSIIEKGIGATSTLSNADLQADSVFLWYPTLYALRAGGASTETVANIGIYSVALGCQSTASGPGSFAMGTSSKATGVDSVAMGAGDYAGYCATSIGQNGSATQAWSATFGGYGNTATGLFGLATGAATLASGAVATSMGGYTTASGDYSISFNCSTQAQSYCSAAFGQFNVGGYSGSGNTTWVSTDPLFEIGNGTSASAPADAFVVYKNGSATLQGPLTVAPSGDIPMYNPTN